MCLNYILLKRIYQLMPRSAQDYLRHLPHTELSQEERCDASVELACMMLEEANRSETAKEKSNREQIARMLQDPKGRQFTFELTDRCFRSHDPGKIADKIGDLLNRYGIPSYLSFSKRAALWLFKHLGKWLPKMFVPLAKKIIRQETTSYVIPGESKRLSQHITKRNKEGIRLNLNHLGEAILGEAEAEKWLQTYLKDLADPQITYISIKISTICSQITLLAWNDSKLFISKQLKRLFRAAMEHPYSTEEGSFVPKFINLDMEEYKDLFLTVEAFKDALEDSEFLNLSAGIVLQAYLPNSFPLQQELTEWAKRRLARGGAPIKIRIVKGANLAMEMVEASLKNWPQAPFLTKIEVDANFKRMVLFGCKSTNAKAVHLGIGSHNLFDIAFSLIARQEQGVEKEVGFEMLEGMADHLRRVVQRVSGGMLLYCPTAKREEFEYAIGYLVRRLDENTAPENFLRHLFDLHYGSNTWKDQVSLFKASCAATDSVDTSSKRVQDRSQPPFHLPIEAPFENEPDTDWTLQCNRIWAEKIIKSQRNDPYDEIPLVIGGEHCLTQAAMAGGEDPSYPNKTLYRYSLAEGNQIETAIYTAVEAQKKFSQMGIKERSLLMAHIAQQLRCRRAVLIGAMVANTGKTVYEADSEVSEAIDFAEYYRRNLEQWAALEDLEWRAKGIVLVAPPWNFSCSIPAGAILASLATGNAVLFKPAPEAVLVGWKLAQIFWESGVSKELLQFITCEEDPYGTALVKDQRVSTIFLTGSTATAKHFIELRPGIDLIAETGGKNAMIITEFADRDLAIKDLIHSAFSYSGQKCSACSLAICVKEVYEDAHFMQKLKDAAASLCVGSQWDFSSVVTPLIHRPGSLLLRGLTVLEEGEEWLLKPVQDDSNPQLWSPGIKIGVQENSFSYRNELFGPMLSVMCAEDLEHAIALANGTSYGLTSGLHSLDERQQEQWIERIEAGNRYINRGITGAIVQRQPFGGCKESSFGQGMKAGGPNYLTQFMVAKQRYSPEVVEPPEMPEEIQELLAHVQEEGLSEEEKRFLSASIKSYFFHWKDYFSMEHDFSAVRGEENRLRYVPEPVFLRLHPFDAWTDLILIVAGATICDSPLEISTDSLQIERLGQMVRKMSKGNIVVREEEEAVFVERVKREGIRRVRFLSHPSQEFLEALSETHCTVNMNPVLGNGRIELLNFLREVSISYLYHRYGNLGS